jgi:prevent-host-death family protein
MTTEITANELKVKGVTLLEQVVDENDGAVITVHGKEKFIVLKIEDYNKLRELELESAIQESKNDIKNGKFYEDDIEKHMKRITNV